MARKPLVHGMTALALLALLAMALVSTACSTRKFTRNELRALETNLSTRLDTNEKSITTLDNKTTEHFDALEKKTNDNASQIVSVKSDITKVDQKATDASNSARNAQSVADRANTGLSSLEKALASLDEKFRNRNDYDLVSEKQVLFKFSSATLGEDFQAPLSEVAAQLKQNPDMFVVLEGHTDSVGDADYNIQLGEKRNDSVTRYLIVSHGVPPYKVFQTSFGKEQPLAVNTSRDGREKNRTVVLRVYRVKSATAIIR